MLSISCTLGGGEGRRGEGERGRGRGRGGGKEREKERERGKRIGGRRETEEEDIKEHRTESLPKIDTHTSTRRALSSIFFSSFRRGLAMESAWLSASLST